MDSNALDSTPNNIWLSAILDDFDSPNSLILGRTGSGKTVALRQIMVAALVRGHDVVLIDAHERGQQHFEIEPWLTALAVTDEEAATALVQAHEEVGRRAKILAREGASCWKDLSKAVRRNELINPLTIVINGFESLVIPRHITKLMAEDSKLLEEAESLNAAKSTVLRFSGKLAREARTAGVRLVIATQHASAELISGELRSNLTSTLLLGTPRAAPSSELLRILFHDSADDAAKLLNGGEPEFRGRGIIQHGDRALSAFQTTYVAPAEAAKDLEASHVSKPEKWDIS